jgi:hypothetical protein
LRCLISSNSTALSGLRLPISGSGDVLDDMKNRRCVDRVEIRDSDV